MLIPDLLQNMQVMGGKIQDNINGLKYIAHSQAPAV